MMRTAFAVQLTNRRRKSEDHTDHLNYNLTVSDVRYYQGRNSLGQLLTAQVQRLARPMTNDLALQVAAKLSGEASEVSVIEIITDDESDIATSLAQLGEEKPVVSPVQHKGLVDLRAAIELCFKEGLGSLEILAAANKAVIQG